MLGISFLVGGVVDAYECIHISILEFIGLKVVDLDDGDNGTEFPELELVLKFIEGDGLSDLFLID